MLSGHIYQLLYITDTAVLNTKQSFFVICLLKTAVWDSWGGGGVGGFESGGGCGKTETTGAQGKEKKKDWTPTVILPHMNILTFTEKCEE